MSEIRLNFLNWRPDAEALSNDGLTVADNVLHDTEGYKPLNVQSGFSASTFFANDTLLSVRSMQIRQVANNSNRVAALVQDTQTTVAMADLTIGLEGEVIEFTKISTPTLSSAGGIRVSSFSVAEMESGGFGVCATYLASLQAGGSTVLSITGEVVYVVESESEGSSGSGTTSLEGTNAEHSQTNTNADAYAGVLLKNDGNEYAFSNDGTEAGTLLSAWLDSGSVDGLYAWASVTSGSLDVDAGTQEWLGLSTDRSWGKRQSTSGTGTAVMELKIATDSGGENIVDSNTYTLTGIRRNIVVSGTVDQYHDLININADCTAGVSFNSNGTEYAYSNGGVATGASLGSWLDGGANSDFYIQCTVISGTLTTGTEDTWQIMSTTRGWTVKETTDGQFETATIKIEIATDALGADIVATGQYVLKAARYDIPT